MDYIRLLADDMIKEGMTDRQSSLLDVGCGSGKYVLHFAKLCRTVTALDYSEKMLEVCREKCQSEGITNVTFVQGDFQTAEFPEQHDIVIACLNPVTYQPDMFDRLLSLASKYVVYFSRDIPLEDAEKEPSYCGCNSVRYAENYLSELDIPYRKLPYLYAFTNEDRTTGEKQFAFLIAGPLTD